MQARAVFLDRDGVIIRDRHLLTNVEDVELYPYAPAAVARLKRAGFRVLVVTNQTVVARGMATEEDVKRVHEWIQDRLVALAGQGVDRFYFCPHHPKANLPNYRQVCQCRKPNPGMLLQAALDFKVDLAGSYMIGDRFSDVLAGQRAGTRTVLVETGMHDAAPIESMPASGPATEPDARCPDLGAAVDRILAGDLA